MSVWDKKCKDISICREECPFYKQNYLCYIALANDIEIQELIEEIKQELKNIKKY